MIEDVVEGSAHIMTDTSSVLRSAPAQYKHSTVNHTADEYVRDEDGVCITTNTVEGYFGIIKRDRRDLSSRRESLPRSVPT